MPMIIAGPFFVIFFLLHSYCKSFFLSVLVSLLASIIRQMTLLCGAPVYVQ
jgi:hypothetical protein